MDAEQAEGKVAEGGQHSWAMSEVGLLVVFEPDGVA